MTDDTRETEPGPDLDRLMRELDRDIRTFNAYLEGYRAAQMGVASGCETQCFKKRLRDHYEEQKPFR